MASWTEIELYFFPFFHSNTQRANMNDYLDVVMEGVADWMRDGGVTPFDLPDLREGFSYKPLLIEYSGWVDLNNGRMLDIARVARAGDCFMSYNRLLLSVEVEAALTEMTVSAVQVQIVTNWPNATISIRRCF